MSLDFILLVPLKAFGQTEKLGIVTYTPPKGWKKAAKENIVTYSELDAAAGKFCTITLYGATPGTGKAQGDFAREWNNLVVKPLAVGFQVSADTKKKLEESVTNNMKSLMDVSTKNTMKLALDKDAAAKFQALLKDYQSTFDTK